MSDATVTEIHARGAQDSTTSPGYRELGELPDDWQSLGHAFVSQARKTPAKIAIRDGTGVSLTFGDTLVRSLVLGTYLNEIVGDDEYVGVLLPPTVPTAVVNLAILLMGRIPVNLNYTAGQEMIDSAIQQCGIRHVITSPKLLEKVHLKPRAQLHMLEDVPGKITWKHKLTGAATAKLVRLGFAGLLLPGLKRFGLDSVATVIFTSGSTGDPKGVVLSHRNILSNIRQFDRQIRLDPNEVVLGILPFFHSFGFTVTVWTPFCLGKEAVYHSSPLDAKTVGKLCEKHGVTLIAGTPTFMRLYLKNCPASQFKSVRNLILGAEKLRPELYREIQSWLGLAPLEGYGTTELSPVVSVNVHERIALPGGGEVAGNRPGTVGLPLPGTRVKTVDPETGEDLPQGTEGIVAIKGPQVMTGYLNRPEATAKAVKDGWYLTGDLGYLDADGFLKITDRMSRFSKIAGEMVPHMGVEAAIIEVTGKDEQQVAITSLPDPKHGERLCVIHTSLEMSPDEIHKALMEKGFPRLWIPSARDFIEVDQIPITGTGKLDLRGLRDVAKRERGGEG